MQFLCSEKTSQPASSRPARSSTAGERPRTGLDSGATIVAEGIETTDDLDTLSPSGSLEERATSWGDPAPWHSTLDEPCGVAAVSRRFSEGRMTVT